MQTNSHEIKLVPRSVQDPPDKQAAIGSRVTVPRARRYDICAAMRYRVRGKKDWHEGLMRNMSISGVLLSTSFSLPLEAIIEMRFSLPVHLTSGEPAAEVLCRGSVVRTSRNELAGGELLVAARVTHSRFLRQER
jgi:hypothetical protein